MVRLARKEIPLSQHIPLLRRPRFNPLLTAAMLAVGYFVFCSLYIWLSGAVAARFSASVADLQRIETIKGVLFITVTTLAVFVLLWFFLNRLRGDEIKFIQQQNELIKSQRESVAGIFASSVAHDINNIIMVLNYHFDQFSKAGSNALELEQIKTETALVLNELKELANRLMHVGKGNLPGEFPKTNLVELVSSTIRFMRKHDALFRCTLEYKGPDRLEINANESALRQMLINLILNAAQAINGKGQIRVQINKTGKSIIIEIHDSGPGIEPDKRNTIFDSFNTTKQNGFGLGLTSVKVYAEMHKGTVEVDESDLGGACFRITLPVKSRKALVS
ncbi:MAG: HAMP domain-containing histidine kinase [Gammaproteobacteria bacterium]|nr:HAMP domain-containing histidine kinase [Gammaproteobacteria bacterium]